MKSKCCDWSVMVDYDEDETTIHRCRNCGDICEVKEEKEAKIVDPMQ